MATVLLTGFEPFAGDAHNPSGAAVSIVGARWQGPDRLVPAVLPVTFAGAAASLARLIAQHDPDIVVATGLAGGRDAVSVERVAVNLQDARIPDNDGVQPLDVPSVDGAAAAVFTTLPAKAIVTAIRDAGIPAELSLSAGSFVCNHIFYHAVHAAAGTARRAGFIHVPWASGQAPAGEPEMALDDIAQALEIAVRTTLHFRGDGVAESAGDISVPGGAAG